MTSVIELLELVAGAEDASFDARDVRRRVHRRRRARRVAAVLSGLVVLGGVAAGGLALAGRGDPNHIEMSGLPAGEPPASLVGRWTPVAYSAVVVPPDNAYVEFLTDGTFRGHDGCNPFHGRWSVAGGRLVTGGLGSGAQLCPDRDTGLVDLLHDDPVIGESDIQAGALELRGGDRFVALARTDTSEPGTAGAALTNECPNHPDGLEASPSSFDPGAGTYAARITDVVPSGPSVSFDVLQWLSGDRAVDAYRQDNPDDPGGSPPNDYYIVDESPRVRSASLSADAVIRLPEPRVAGAVQVGPATIDELADQAAVAPDDVYWLTFLDGRITELCRQYRP